MLNEKDLTRYLHLMFLMVYGGSIYSFDYTFASTVFFFFSSQTDPYFFQNFQQNQIGFLSFSADRAFDLGKAIIISYFTVPTHNRHLALIKPKVIG